MFKLTVDAVLCATCDSPEQNLALEGPEDD